MALQGDQYLRDRGLRERFSEWLLEIELLTVSIFLQFFWENKVKWIILEILCDSEVEGGGGGLETNRPDGRDVKNAASNSRTIGMSLLVSVVKKFCP